MTIFQDANGASWQMDYDGCLWVLRAWAQEKARLSALSIRGGNGGFREINFDATTFRSERDRLYREQCSILGGRLIDDGNQAVSLLASRYEETDRLDEQARARFRQVNSHNMQQVERNVTFGENMVTGLTLVRDASAIVFMCLIPVAAAAGSIGVGTGLALRFGGSVFQGVGTYQDTGSVGAAIANANFAFTSSLMNLPPSAGRGAQVLFTITNTTNTVVRNAAISYITPGQNTRPFTEVIRQQLISEVGGQVAEGILGDIAGKLSMAVLPVAMDAAGDGSRTGRTPSTDDLPRMPNGDLISELPEGLRATAMREWLDRRRAAQEQAEQERLWRSTPFYRYMLTGERVELMSSGERFVRGNLLRET